LSDRFARRGDDGAEMRHIGDSIWTRQDRRSGPNEQQEQQEQQEENPMAQYLISVWHDEDYADEAETMAPEVIERMHAQVGALNEDIQASGAWLFAGGLVSASSATVIRPNGDGTVTMTDGPYAEGKEMMGGFWVVELADLDAALELAGRCSLACEGSVEVRPFQG